MNQQSAMEIGKMLNAFPQSAGNVKALLLTFGEDLTGLSDAAIQETAKRFRQGTIPDQSLQFAPSIASFRAAAEAQQDLISARSRPRLPAPSYPHGPSAHDIRKEQERIKYANREVLHRDVPVEFFKNLSARQEIAPGTCWYNGTIYGPEPVSIRKSA